MTLFNKKIMPEVDLIKNFVPCLTNTLFNQLNGAIALKHTIMLKYCLTLKLKKSLKILFQILDYGKFFVFYLRWPMYM